VAETYTSKYATGAAVDAALDKAESALQPGDVDDTPVSGVTDAPVSSNWAFDHAANLNAHGISDFGETLVDDADAPTARSTLGLGNAATKNVGTTSGTVAAGDHAHASTYQPLDADLTAIAALAVTDGNIIVGNGTTWVAETGATARTSLGLGTGDSPQFTAVNVGHASDTTIARVSAGVISVEGVTVATASNTLSLTNKTLTGLKETKVAVSATEIDLATGNYFTKTISGTTAFTVTNVPSSGTAVSFILDLTNGGSATVSFSTGFTSVKYAGGAAPTLTASGRDVLGFFTHDGGSTWTCLLLGKDVK